jgi:beta-glucosidase
MKKIKNKSYFSVLFMFIGCALSIHAQQTNKLPQLGKSPIKAVIAAMTLEEKASMLTGAGLDIPPSAISMLGEDMKRMIPKAGTLAANTKSPISLAAGTSVAIPRLGIPCVVLNDGPAGLRMLGGKYQCTAFPIGTLLASTWNKKLIYETGKAYGNEVLEYGIDVLLAPGMNIQRNPLCGRNFEYYSEDPLLSGKIAAAMVNGIQSQGVGTSIKHFAANNQETDRQTVNTIVSQRALREIYLKGFEIAIQESNPWTVMSSYNLLNGHHTSESADLITTILRKEWGFKGMVMSDWISGHDFVAQVKAGTDLLMPGPYQVNTIIKAVKDGRLSEKVLDRNIENILNLVLKSPRFKKYKFSDQPNSEENVKTSRIAAAEGVILLKNMSSTLPLSNNIKSVALFGNSSYDTYIGGSGSGYVATTHKVSIFDGFNNAGYKTDVSLKEMYKTYMKANAPKQTDMVAAMLGGKKRAPEMPLEALLVEKMAEEVDIAFVAIGRNSGETADRNIENDFNLSDTEKKNLDLIADKFHAKGKKVVVVLNIGGVIETASWKERPEAILLAWQPGIEAGNAIVDLISGKVNPSGKLAVTFPRSYTDVPSAKYFPGEVVKGDSIINREVVYKEGIYVGYRYYSTFGVSTSYPFGYGLSYTSFKYSGMKLSTDVFNNSVEVIVTVTNTGSIPGKEIVQMYISAPVNKMDKPTIELKNFAKTELLKPGQSQEIRFNIQSNDLASFYTSKSAWIADAGIYYVKVGSSSEDIKLSKSFNLNKEIVVEKTNKALVPQVNIDELKGEIK